MIQKGKHEETLRILLYFALFALFVGQGSAARIVRSGIWWWLVVLRGDNCHSGGPGSTLGLCVCRLGKHNLGLLYYCWTVFTFLKCWVYIDLDRMSFFKRCAITKNSPLALCLSSPGPKEKFSRCRLHCDNQKHTHLGRCAPARGGKMWVILPRI